MSDNFYLSFDFKSKVSHDVFEKKMNVNRHPHFTSMSSCQIVHVISNFNVLVDVWFFSLHESHYTSHFELCMSIDMQLFSHLCASFCVRQMSKLAKIVIHTHTHKHWPHGLGGPWRIWTILAESEYIEHDSRKHQLTKSTYHRVNHMQCV